MRTVHFGEGHKDRRQQEVYRAGKPLTQIAFSKPAMHGRLRHRKTGADNVFPFFNANDNSSAVSADHVSSDLLDLTARPSIADHNVDAAVCEDHELL